VEWRAGDVGATERLPYVRLRSLLLVVGATVATALAAQIKVWLPGTPVPVTLQTLAVLLTGFALGPRLAPAAMLAYLGLGAAGLPFFALGAASATVGYLIGFVFAAALVGRLAGAAAGSWWRTAAVAAAGNLVIFAAGLAWLVVWWQGNVAAAFWTGLVPFLSAEALKTGLAVVGVRAWRLTVRPGTK
jgi:biotin transport system substrate-specific component